MKAKKILFLSLAIVAVFTTMASPEVRTGDGLQPACKLPVNPFASFRTHRQGKGISASWSVSSADGIVSFTVQRTYEDPTDPYAYWEELKTMPFNAARSFTYKDQDVLPGVINYRIVALMGDGSTTTSDVSSVRIVSH